MHGDSRVGRVATVGASIVLYRTRFSQIAKLVESLLQGGVTKLYLVDNSPPDFDTFQGWPAPDNVEIHRGGGNIGYGGGNNVAIRDSVKRHDYHLVLNPDIHLDPMVIAELRRYMEERSDVGLLMPEVRGPDGQRHYLCKRAPAPYDFVPLPGPLRSLGSARRAYFEMRDHDYDSEFEVECLSGCFMFFRCSVLAQLRGFDERFFLYLEDFDLSRRSRRIARNVYFPGVHVVHEHSRGHMRSWKLRLSFARSIMNYFWKWGWFESSTAREGRN